MVGEIVDLALRYRDEGADELVFYDITASPEQRTVARHWVEQVARVIDIPFCVAGGIRSVDEARAVLHAGADKISVNSPALERPQLIGELAAAFGVQCVVVGIDSLRDDDGQWRVRQYTGDPSRTRALPRATMDWIDEAQRRGAGEIVLNCMGSDGVRQGYDLDQLRGGPRDLPRPVDRLRRCRRAGAFRRRLRPGGRRRCPGRQRLPFRCHRHSRAQAVPAWAGRCRAPLTPARDTSPMTDITHPDAIDTELAWAKGDGLLPAIVQHWLTGEVLMLGYMNPEALAATRASGKVTFFSRSKARLWTKGESSGHHLAVKAIHLDCDRDTLLVQAQPHGPTCHTGTTSCFGNAVRPPLGFLAELDDLIARRNAERPTGSYTTGLFESGLRRIAQKVGEEGVETALAAVVQDDAALLGEAADLLFHLGVALRARGLGLGDAVEVLAQRHAQSA